MRWLDSKGRLFEKISLLDIGAGLLLLLVGGTVSYGVQIADHNRLKLISVEPSQIVAGGTQYLKVIGNHIRGRARGVLVQEPMTHLHSVSHVQVSYSVTDDLAPGQWTLILENESGELTRFRNALEIIWQPKIDKVTPARFVSGRKWDFIVEGDYFERGCSLLVNSQVLDPNAVRVVGRDRMTQSHRIQATRIYINLPPGRYPVEVINPNGRKAVLANAIEVVQREPASFKVTCVLDPASTESLRASDLKKLGDSWKWSAGRVLNLNVQGFGKDQKERIILLQLLLHGEAELSDSQTRYFYRKKEVKLGVPIPVFLWGAGPQGSTLELTGFPLSKPQAASDAERNLF